MLQAGALVFDEEGNQVDVAAMRRCYEEWGELIQYCDDMEGGLIIMTHTEYEQTPEIIMQARRIFRGEWQKWKQDHQKQ